MGSAPSRHEFFGALEVRGGLLAGDLADGRLEQREVVDLLVVVVVVQRRHHLVQQRRVLLAARLHALELVQLLFHLLPCALACGVWMGRGGERTYQVLLPVVVRELLALVAEMLLHQRVDNYLLADGMSRDLPTQLVGPASARLDVVLGECTLVLVVVLIHLPSRLAQDCQREYMRTSSWSSLMAWNRVFCAIGRKVVERVRAAVSWKLRRRI